MTYARRKDSVLPAMFVCLWFLPFVLFAAAAFTATLDPVVPIALLLLGVVVWVRRIMIELCYWEGSFR